MLPSVQVMEAYIRQKAAALGIDPNVAVAVARSEGLQEGTWQARGNLAYGRERSYGPFQLHVDPRAGHGGMGNDFIKATGLDPSDPANWQKGVDFALTHASKNGWGAWYGPQHLEHPITGMMGIGGQPAPAAAPAPMGASLGSFTGGMTDVALRQPAIVQPIPTGDLPPAAGAGGKGGPGNSPYERQMRNAMEKEGRPQREIDAGMAQAANVKSPSLPGLGGGGGKGMPDLSSLGGGGGKGGMSSAGGKGDLPPDMSLTPPAAPEDTGPGYALPPVITAPKAPVPTAKPPSQNMNLPPVQGPNQPYFATVGRGEGAAWNSWMDANGLETESPGGIPYDASKSPAWDYNTKRFMPPVRPR